MENKAKTNIKDIVKPTVSQLQSRLQLSIRRKDQNSGLPGDDSLLQNPKIGSSFNGRAPLSGLSMDEEHIYLPEIIGIAPKDINWRKEVKEYWNNISERVPHDKEGTNSRLPGRVLSFTVKFDTTKDKDLFEKAKTFEEKAAFSKKGVVIDGIADYVLFRYCLVYSRVSNSKADMYKSGKIAFYLYSQETEAKKNYTLFQQKNQAKAMFATMLEDETKINALLRLFGEDPLDTFMYFTPEDKHLKLDELISKNPTRFITYANDKSLKEKALVKQAVIAGIIHNPANTDSYYYGDDKQVVLGNTLNDAVLFLRSKEDKNVQVLESIKAQVKYSKA